MNEGQAVAEEEADVGRAEFIMLELTEAKCYDHYQRR